MSTKQDTPETSSDGSGEPISKDPYPYLTWALQNIWLHWRECTTTVPKEPDYRDYPTRWWYEVARGDWDCPAREKWLKDNVL